MAQKTNLPKAFVDGFEFFCSKLQRSGTTGGVGLVYDRYMLNQGSDLGPISIASTGFGMIIVCIGCELGLMTKSHAVKLTLETLKSLLGERAGFSPKRSPQTNFFAHFLNATTGDFDSASTEISTIDTAILAAGAMFARNYLKNLEVTQKTNALVYGINWGAAFGNTEWLPMVMDRTTGNPVWNQATKPFNEYFVLAYVGKIVEEETKKTGPATSYFSKYYSNPPQSLRTAGAANKSYWGYSVWSDNESHFASSFQVQFCYYLSKYFQWNSTYQTIFNQAAAADWTYFQNVSASGAHSSKYAPYQWGCGAGEYPPPKRYFAAAIENNDKLVYSAPIMAGFFPADSAIQSFLPASYVGIDNALSHLYTSDVCTFHVDGKKILWRQSLLDQEWKPNTIQSVDFSTLLLGYAWKLAGADFFSNAI